MYLNSGGGYLQVVQPPQGALSVSEVGSSQLVQQLQRHHRAVQTSCSSRIRLPVQLLLVQEDGQGLFPWKQTQCEGLGVTPKGNEIIK